MLGIQGALNRMAGTSGVGDQAAANAAADRVGAMESSGGRLLTTGEFTMSRYLPIQDTAAAVNSQELLLHYFTAARTESVGTITTWTGATLAAATPTVCRYGLYTEAANGDITLVASTANDTTLFAAANTIYARSLSVAYTKQIGQRYAVGILVVSGAAMPSYYGLVRAGNAAIDTMLSTAPRVSGLVTAQADLPASVVTASITTTRRNFIAKLT